MTKGKRFVLISILIISVVFTNTAFASQESEAITISIVTDTEGAERIHSFLSKNGYAMPTQRFYSQSQDIVPTNNFDTMQIIAWFVLFILILTALFIAVKVLKYIGCIIKERLESENYNKSLTYVTNLSNESAYSGERKTINIAERLGARYYA